MSLSSSGTGCIFSLEFFVQTVTSEFPVSHPCVGFRLLDFPTVIVDPIRVKEKRTEVQADSDKDTPDKNRSPVTVEFNCGKSALFRLPSEESLYALLRSVPLYVMLINGPPKEKTQLLGSLSIDLSCFKYDVRLSHQKGYRRGTFSFSDLMGNDIGSIEVILRLSTLGHSVASHFSSQTKIDLSSLAASGPPRSGKTSNGVETAKVVPNSKKLSGGRNLLQLDEESDTCLMKQVEVEISNRFKTGKIDTRKKFALDQPKLSSPRSELQADRPPALFYAKTDVPLIRKPEEPLFTSPVSLQKEIQNTDTKKFRKEKNSSPKRVKRPKMTTKNRITRSPPRRNRKAQGSVASAPVGSRGTKRDDMRILSKELGNLRKSSFARHVQKLGESRDTETAIKAQPLNEDKIYETICDKRDKKTEFVHKHYHYHYHGLQTENIENQKRIEATTSEQSTPRAVSEPGRSVKMRRRRSTTVNPVHTPRTHNRTETVSKSKSAFETSKHATLNTTKVPVKDDDVMSVSTHYSSFSEESSVAAGSHGVKLPKGTEQHEISALDNLSIKSEHSTMEKEITVGGINSSGSSELSNTDTNSAHTENVSDTTSTSKQSNVLSVTSNKYNKIEALAKSESFKSLSSTPSQSGIPTISETPNVSETPNMSETPNVSETPNMSETPNVSETPDVSETPCMSKHSYLNDSDVVSPIKIKQDKIMSLTPSTSSTPDQSSKTISEAPTQDSKTISASPNQSFISVFGSDYSDSFEEDEV
eukprot:347686_1